MLGIGAFAVVYRARDPALHVDVAIKVLAEQYARDPETSARFIAEARTLRQLSDERIVNVHDIGEFDGRPYLVMELLHGGTLADRLAGNRTLGTDDIEWLIDGLGGALVVIHAAGFVHRDVKPSNLLIRPDDRGNRLVVADFGLARSVDRSRITAARAHGYVAPEQRVPGADVDGRADVHAASAVVGRAAFGEDWQRILVPSGAAQATALEPSGTEPLAFELRRGLSADPADRHHSISEWTDSLLDAVADHSTVVRTHDETPHRRPVVRVVAGALVVLALVLAAATIARPAGSGNDRPVTPVATGEPAGPPIIGPDQILIGDEARFTHADRDGVDYRWDVPDGATVNGDTVIVTPTEAVDLEITLIESERGEERSTTRVVEVRTR